MGERICIIGGSGFVGRAVTRAAAARGHSVTIACRHPERARDLQVDGALLVKTDIIDGHGLEHAVHGADCVINLVGLLFEKGRYTFEAAHVRGAEHVLAACKQAGVKQYLHMSALGADAYSASAYARTKAAAEERVRQSGLAWTIFRPSIIYGAGDSFFNKFKKLSALMPILPVIEGNTRFQPVWVENVARAFIASVGNRHVQKKTYKIGGPSDYSFRELLEMMLAITGRKRLLIPVPRPMARMMALFMQFLPTPQLTPDQLALLQCDNIIKGAAFPPEFGEPDALEEILPACLSGNRAVMMQQRLNHERRQYWKAR